MLSSGIKDLLFSSLLRCLSRPAFSRSSYHVGLYCHAALNELLATAFTRLWWKDHFGGLLLHECHACNALKFGIHIAYPYSIISFQVCHHLVLRPVRKTGSFTIIFWGVPTRKMNLEVFFLMPSQQWIKLDKKFYFFLYSLYSYNLGSWQFADINGQNLEVPWVCKPVPKALCTLLLGPVGILL